MAVERGLRKAKELMKRLEKVKGPDWPYELKRMEVQEALKDEKARPFILRFFKGLFGVEQISLGTGKFAFRVLKGRGYREVIINPEEKLLANRFSWAHEQRHLERTIRPWYLDEADAVLQEYFLVTKALGTRKAAFLAVDALHALKPLFRAEEILRELEKQEKVDEKFVRKLRHVLIYGLVPAWYIGKGWRYVKPAHARMVEQDVLDFLARKYPRLRSIAKKILRGTLPNA